MMTREQKTQSTQAIDVLTDRSEAASAPKNVVVNVRNLHVHADHYVHSEIVAGLANGNEVNIDSTWSDGRNIWAQLDQGWAVMVYDGETCIKPV
jgi:hypothetical protein